MAAWFEPDDLDSFFSQKDLAMYTTGSGVPATPDDAVLQALLDRAQRLITNEVAALGTVGTVAKGSILWDIGIDLTAEMLFTRVPGQASQVPKGWMERIKQSRDQLRRILDGELPCAEITLAQIGPTRLMAVIAEPTDVDKAFGNSMLGSTS